MFDEAPRKACLAAADAGGVTHKSGMRAVHERDYVKVQLQMPNFANAAPPQMKHSRPLLQSLLVGGGLQRYLANHRLAGTVLNPLKPWRSGRAYFAVVLGRWALPARPPFLAVGELTLQTAKDPSQTFQRRRVLCEGHMLPASQGPFCVGVQLQLHITVHDHLSKRSATCVDWELLRRLPLKLRWHQTTRIQSCSQKLLPTAQAGALHCGGLIGNVRPPFLVERQQRAPLIPMR
mmetsp:Transcript_32899/g.70025  ORF Transcript_32899/g.70025 Transcript_32899/m.70025 type:complete len:234 (-) Transcript_32899:436-1137(-)